MTKMKKIHGARPCIYGANNWTRSIIAHYSYSLLSFSFNTKRLRITIFLEKNDFSSFYDFFGSFDC